MSSIIYNGITIENVLLQSIDQHPVYDEEGGADPIAIRTQVVVKGTLFAGTLATVSLGNQVGSNLSFADERLRKLSEPKKRFQYLFGDGNTLFDVGPSAVVPNSGITLNIFGGSSDLNNGPRPFVRVDRITGSKAMHITFGIEFWRWECDDLNQVVNLRYYCTEDVSENWYRVRTYQGRLRLRSRASQPHAFRNYVLPPLQGGFKRERMSFQESPDGLSLTFQITDREMHAAPPFPSTTWSGSYSISTYDGSSVVETVDVRLKAPPKVAKTDLLNVALQIVDIKLQILQSTADERPVVIQNATFGESLDDNEVYATFQVRHTRNPLDRLVFVGAKQFGKPLPAFAAVDGSYDPSRFQYPILPDSLAGLFTSAIQDPCNPASIPKEVYTLQTPDEEADEEGEDREESNESALDGIINPLLDQEAQRSLYTDYKISSEVVQSSGQYTFPLSVAVNGSTAANIQFHAGRAERIIRVEAERVGLPPVLPSPVAFTDQVNGIAHALIDHKEEVVAPKLAPDGVSKIYRIEMEIRYGLSRPLTTSDRRYSGTLPYDTFTLEANMLPASVFVPPGSSTNSLA